MHRLPVELLWRVFELLNFDEILPARCVCREWRHIATAHPHFWRQISIQSPQPHSLQQAYIRVGAAGKRSFALNIELNDRSRRRNMPRILDLAILFLHRKFLKSLLTFMTDNIQQVDKLRLVIHERYIPSIYSALVHPAPHLQSLELWVLADSYKINLALPSCIFGNHAPHLQLAVLHEVVLPSTPIPAFSVVDEVVLSFAPNTTFPFLEPACFSFPALQDLTLYGGHMYLDQPLSEPALSVVFRLQRLNMDIGTVEELRSMCEELSPLLKSLPALSLWAPDTMTIHTRLEDLAAPWHLSISESEPGDIRVEITSELSGKTRYFGDRLAGAAQLLAFDGRLIRNLTLETSLWSAIHHALPVFDDLHEVRVRVNTAQLPAGELRTVRDAAPEVMHIDLDLGQDSLRLCATDFEQFLAGVSMKHSVLHVDKRIVFTDGEGAPIVLKR